VPAAAAGVERREAIHRWNNRLIRQEAPGQLAQPRRLTIAARRMLQADVSRLD
jgi:hypothetical protein